MKFLKFQYLGILAVGVLFFTQTSFSFSEEEVRLGIASTLKKMPEKIEKDGSNLPDFEASLCLSFEKETLAVLAKVGKAFNLLGRKDRDKHIFDALGDNVSIKQALVTNIGLTTQEFDQVKDFLVNIAIVIKDRIKKKEAADKIIEKFDKAIFKK